MGSTRTQLSHMAPICHPPPHSVALVSWQYFLFLEIISSGEKSGLVYFILGGSCYACWVCRPSPCCSWMVRQAQGKQVGKVLVPQVGLSLITGSGDVTKKFFCQNANNSIPSLQALCLVFGAFLFIFHCYLKICLFHKSMTTVSASDLSSENGSGLCCWVPGLCEISTLASGS